eukprot:CAMPEP_0198138388 /NCGR_PEP_ID=MMETSP1443-20131203/1804_1 /TAXON_ID=186043 /ORGANISM="Entomoneis sp., Strain CCMP2396" /LENGTH=289 /DNA_ID=CAMNT_0043800147 /DNA_START=26 /DNA_END=895 /DNA_ORIENTATION=-
MQRKRQAMNTDNPPVHDASHSDAEADDAGDAEPNTDILAAEKKPAESKIWKLKIVLLVFVLFVTIFSRAKNRSAIIQDVIASSFKDDFPNSLLQEEALDWLVNEDPAKLAVDTNPTTLLERYIAVLFYFANHGDCWSNSSRWLTSNAVCSWSGLECNDQGVLTTMNLTKMNLCTCVLPSFCLVGQIPSELAVLTNLEYLSLPSNNLSGPIPSELGLLTELTYLDLWVDALRGPIPSELGLLTKITHLDLADNALTGSVPSELHHNPGLYLEGNSFTNCEEFKALCVCCG